MNWRTQIWPVIIRFLFGFGKVSNRRLGSRAPFDAIEAYMDNKLKRPSSDELENSVLARDNSVNVVQIRFGNRRVYGPEALTDSNVPHINAHLTICHSTFI
jgi:hypothetical protein